MDARKTTSLALKLIGIYILVERLDYLWMYAQIFYASRFGYPPGGETTVVRLLMLGTLLVYFIVCILLIVKSDVIARWLVSESDNAEVTTGLDADTLQTIAFVTIGVVLLAAAIPRFVQFCASYLFLKSETGISYPNYGQLVGPAVQAAIGAALFLGAEGLVRIWHRLRTTRTVEDQQGSTEGFSQ